MELYKLNFSGFAVITDRGERFTYTELAKASDEWASKVPPRKLVFLLVKNNITSLIAYIACLRNKIVPLLLDADTNSAVLDILIRTYRPYEIFNCVTGYEHPVINDSPSLHEDLALLLTTSGSTGSPKLVRQSYTNIMANTAAIIDYLQLCKDERPITTLPMNYTYGLSIINSHLHSGGTILLTTKNLMEREFWQFFTTEEATSFGGVPYTYEMLDRIMFFRRKLPSLRTMTQAGGKILPSLQMKFADYAQREGKKFVVMYGQCEATARMSYLPPERALEKVGSMGIAIPGGKFTLIDAKGETIIEPNVTGELVYEGKNVTLGYAECAEDLAKGDERKGKLFTGDMAKFDEEGYYYIVGRKKRFLKIFGNRINLDETERLIKDRFANLECACVGVDDKMKIYLTKPKMKEEVVNFLSHATRLNGAAFEIKEIDTIPKNESGKTLYSKLV